MISNLNQLRFPALVPHQQPMTFLSLMLPTKSVGKKDKLLKVKVKETKPPSLLLLTKAVGGKEKILQFMIMQTPSTKW